MQRAPLLFRFALAMGIGVCIRTPAFAQTAEEFYRSHPITFVVSSGAGGGYDVYTRLLARFFGRHMPGSPKTIVQNMPGADGITAINYIANVAPRDGTVVGDSYSTTPFYMLIDGRNAKFDPQTITWLGSLSNALGVCVARHGSSFNTIDDVMHRSMRVSSTGSIGWRVILPRLYNITVGSKFDVISGYGPGGDFLAVENGEVDGICTFYDTLLASKGNWIKSNKVDFLLQFGNQPAPELQSVPVALDQIKDGDDHAAMKLILAQQQTGHPYLAPPGIPADRAQALQTAFSETIKDPEFVSAARDANLWLEDPMSASQVIDLIRNAYATTPAVINHAKSLLERAVER
jgi:tripartite-type tricarboxylate transporter receptor subunit TctC